MNLRSVYLVAAASLSLAVGTSWGGTISAKDAKSHIHDVGAKAAIAMWSGTETWKDIYRGIASGGSEWLEVAKMLKPESDAGGHEDLSDAVSEALPKKPVEVLRFVRNGRGYEEFTVEEVCTASPRSERKSEALRFLRKSERAVRAIHAADLKEPKGRCLKSLAESRQEVLSWPAD